MLYIYVFVRTIYFYIFFFFFFFNDPATTEIYTLSLHDALPIYRHVAGEGALRLAVAHELPGWPTRDDRLVPSGEEGHPEQFCRRCGAGRRKSCVYSANGTLMRVFSFTCVIST